MYWFSSRSCRTRPIFRWWISFWLGRGLVGPPHQSITLLRYVFDSCTSLERLHGGTIISLCPFPFLLPGTQPCIIGTISPHINTLYIISDITSNTPYDLRVHFQEMTLELEYISSFLDNDTNICLVASACLTCLAWLYSLSSFKQSLFPSRWRILWPRAVKLQTASSRGSTEEKWLTRHDASWPSFTANVARCCSRTRPVSSDDSPASSDL